MQSDAFPGPITLLGVWAHPDDEAYLSAGLMHRVVQAGGRVVLVSATRGEQGRPDDWRASGVEIGKRRERELRAASDVLGVDDVRFLDFQDGDCAGVPMSFGATDVASELTAVGPDLVVTFGTDGITGHPDHIAVSRWVTRAWMESDRRADLWFATTTPRFSQRFGDVHHRLGLFPDGYPRVAADDELVAQITLDDGELDVKRAVLAAHASQTRQLARLMGESTYRRWFDVESFRRPRAIELDAAFAQPARALTGLA